MGRRARHVAVAGAVTVALVACGPTVVDPVEEVSRLEIIPGSSRLVDAGDSVLLMAQELRSDGTIETVDASWLSRDPAVAVVSPVGWVTAVSDGAATIDATSGSLSATARVFVNSDTIGPVLTDLFVDRDLVDVFEEPQLIEITARLEEVGSGVESLIGVFSETLFGNTGINGLVVFEHQEAQDTTLASGAIRSWYEGRLEIPRLWIGLWTLTTLEATDLAGNESRWDGEALEELGLDIQVRAVTGGGG